ncbi:MAG TPA: PAS domain S-box protein, partial [Acidiferrobacteraceae bacterium]|nr:PAS domain S-box protein [Acidiferrobacteraceae bacterium]
NFLDITERKWAERKFGAMFDAIPDAAIFADKQHRIVTCNPAVYEMFGYSEQELTGKTVEILYADKQDFIDQGKQRYHNGVKTSKGTYELKYKRKDGNTFWAESNGTPVRDANGSAIGFISLFRDITERKQEEKGLKRTNQSLRALSACNVALVRSGSETELLNMVCHIIVNISEYRLAWVGLAEHDEAKTVRAVAQAGYDESYLESLELSWADTEKGQGPTGVAIRTGKANIIHNIFEDSRFVPWREAALKRGYRSSIALPLNDKGQTFGALNIYACEGDAFSEDEVAFLQQLADDLSYGVVVLRSHQERRQLNIQLRQAQKMETIGQLTGGIAHDFNNILASILGFTSLALQRFVSDDQPELREYLNEVSQAGERARDLVSQMLAFSRTGSSTASQLPLAPMIKEAVKMLRATLPSSIELSGQYATDAPAVMMNPVQLQQVLMNMCINARDAIGDKGRIDIRVRRVCINNGDKHTEQVSPNDAALRHSCDACHNEIEPGDWVELSVCDTGAGIRGDELERIFEPFFTTKDVDKGTGMGLSMVYGIIHQHEGHILVDTKLGAGTTFRLLLPVAEDGPMHKSDIELDASPKAGSLNAARILIIDDEESVARFMGSLLESRGGKVTVLTDSQAALDLFFQDPTAFDLIITDQTMPCLTGVELAQKVLALRPELPMILCTGYSEQVDEAKAMALGIRGYLTKPMQIKTLFNMVVELLAI